jgi:hypothetical protein
VYMKNDLQRIWRDGIVAAAHHGLMWDFHGLAYGRLVVGLTAMPDPAGI